MKHSFRAPHRLTAEGHYITKTQLKFFLNDYKPTEKIAALCTETFTKYYENCVLYNLIYDAIQKDPGCAEIYWDSKKETVAIRVPKKGPFPSVETLPPVLGKIKNPFLPKDSD